MEFKLNKIDTDIRKKMQEETKDDKVHSSESISVKKDLKDEKNEFYNEEQNLTKEESEKRYITIDGIRYSNKNINIKAEKVEKVNESNSKGRILDTKK